MHNIGLWIVCHSIALVVPVLLICLSTDLKDVHAQTKEALKWTGMVLLITQCASFVYVWRKNSCKAQCSQLSHGAVNTRSMRPTSNEAHL